MSIVTAPPSDAIAEAADSADPGNSYPLLQRPRGPHSLEERWFQTLFPTVTRELLLVRQFVLVFSNKVQISGRVPSPLAHDPTKHRGIGALSPLACRSGVS